MEVDAKEYVLGEEEEEATGAAADEPIGESPEGLVREEHEKVKEKEPEPSPPPQPAAPQQAQPDYAQIADLQRQLGALQAKIEAAQKQPEKQPELQYPTEEDWARDPTAAAKVTTAIELNKMRQELYQREAQQQRQAEQQRQQYQQLQTVRSAQQKSFQSAVQLVPELADNKSQIRRVADALYNDKSTGLQNLPSGAFAAAAMAHFITTKLGQQAETQESTRTASVKRGAMTASGRSGKTSTGRDLTKEEAALCKDFQISKEAFLAAKQQKGM